ETVRPPSPVRVERVIANDNTLLPTPGLRLPPRSSRLQFDYTVVNLTSPMRTHFRYKLEGYDSDWIDAGTRRQAFYTNLPPGAYRFRVVARSDDNAWQDTEALWEFAIAPRFYQTTAFRATVAGFLALSVWAGWRLRVLQLRRRFAVVLKERA